eukprot:189440-Alexandrium_andersonii.AAC.1
MGHQPHAAEPQLRRPAAGTDDPAKKTLVASIHQALQPRTRHPCAQLRNAKGRHTTPPPGLPGPSRTCARCPPPARVSRRCPTRAT